MWKTGETSKPKAGPVEAKTVGGLEREGNATLGTKESPLFGRPGVLAVLRHQDIIRSQASQGGDWLWEVWCRNPHFIDLVEVRLCSHRFLLSMLEYERLRSSHVVYLHIV